MLSPTSLREIFFAYPPSPHCGACLPLLWSLLFPPYAPALTLLFFATMRPSLTFTLSRDPRLMTLFLFIFGKGGSGVLANCSFYGTEAALSFSEGLVCSSCSAEACTILQAFHWSRQHQQVCYFFSLSLRLLLCPLLYLSFYLKLSGRSGRNCLFFLLCYQATMGSRTFVFSVERHV